VILAIAWFRLHAAEFVDDFAWVYTIALIAYIVSGIVFTVGLRIPYNRWSDAILTFLRDVSEPLLRVFRRILPSFGGLDLSPMLAIIVVRLAGSLVTRAIISG
jgi:YggT family protein